MTKKSLRWIIKRDGTVNEFDKDKIIKAITKAGAETGEFTQVEALKITEEVIKKLAEVDEKLNVEHVQDRIEFTLMDFDYKATAKAYIIYREKQAEGRKRDIFKPRLNLKPYEYPELELYKEAIQHSYWLHTEFNYTSDIQDFKVNVTEAERNAIKNAMLAISQVEVTVKTFWGDLYHRMPKPELGSVGYTFAESEVRHHDAYAHLLEILGFNEEFEKIGEIPALIDRVNYLQKSSVLAKTGEDKDYMLALLLFSLFIEHVSLFSQFLIIMSFNRYKNLFKGMSNAIEATSKEEQLHGLFGIDLINVIREEKPEWFDENLERAVYDACKLSYESEEKVIDWIYEAGDLDFMPKYNVKEYVKNRLNNSLASVGYERIFEVDENALDITEFLEDGLRSTAHIDFFNKRSVNYSKRTKPITSDDLF